MHRERGEGRAGRVGRYQVLSRLAVGGMAELFLALATNPDGTPALVTLKRILPDLAAQDEFVRMFINEARISLSLEHQNIARVYELGNDEGELFIAMEFVAGQSLTNILRAFRTVGRPVPLGFAAMVARDLCRALQAAHELTLPSGELAPVIHRDVSPNNIMVTYAGEVRVIDFGVAKAKGSLSRTGNDVVKGSIGYMSPEQARGLKLDARSDLFSAATVLHELLTGRPLFLRESELLTFRGILRDDLPSPIQVNPGVPRALSDVVMRALARPPEQRFESADAMRRAIEKALPALMFTQVQASELMVDLFEEPIERTRLLVERLQEGAELETLVRTAQGLSTATGHASSVPEPLVGRPLGQATDVYGTMSTGVMRLRKGLPEAVSARAPVPESSPIPLATPAKASLAPMPLGPPARVVEVPAGPLSVEGAVVLSVDDSDISRAFIEAHLESFGFPVLGCATADEALKMLDERVPDLILLDVNMPDVDGYELCRRIRAHCTQRPFLPILFLSSALSFEERLKGLAAGGDDFLGKPYEPQELVAVVRAHLQRAGFLEQLARERAVQASRGADDRWQPVTAVSEPA